MKKLLFLLMLLAVSVSQMEAAERVKGDKKLLKKIEKTLDFAVEQELRLYEAVKEKPKRMPRTYEAKNDSLVLCPIAWWTSGFFPGTMWYLYEHSGREDVRQIAETLTARMEPFAYRTNNHDIGFAINCSYGNGYRLTKNEDYRKMMLTAAGNLATRFSPVVGCTRSWDNRPQWGFTVIIDNMMNLELLGVATQLGGDARFLQIACSHADVTMKNHFRPDYSTYHVVGYDEQTGEARVHVTHQGYADHSAWSRGQAWALYGYTMMYRLTGEQRYLEQATNIGKFLMNHPRLPKDKIPYWDYDTPMIPNALRDASAGALMASAYIELSQMVEGDLAGQFLRLAEEQLHSLCSPAYLAKAGKNGNFLLMHSTGNHNRNSEMDVPLSYADYYFVEAMLRYQRLCAGKPVVDQIK